MRRRHRRAFALAATLGAAGAIVPASNALASEVKAPTRITVIKRIYPDLYQREINRTPTSWGHLRKMAATRWWRTHPAAARHMRIQELVRQANNHPPGLKTAGGSRWVPNSANYALFTVLYPGEVGECLRVISGRETGGTYDHRVGYGFIYNAPHAVPAYGLPQSNPPSKLLAAGSDAYTNPVKQIHWMKRYADARYGGACNAMRHHLAGGSNGATY